MKEWQFDVLFIVGVGGAVVVLFGSLIGLDVGKNPTAAAGVGAILTYILTQKKALTKHDDKKEPEKKTDPDEKGAKEDGPG